jgi:uncharacterized protein YjdB
MKSLFLSTILVLLAATGFATVVTVNASSTGTTTTTTKTAGTITVNNTTNRGYAVFNLASAGIPAAATITSVKLIFTYTISGSGTPTRTVYGYVGDISVLAAASLYSGAVTANTLYTASWGNAATTKTMASTAGADTFIQHNHTNTVSVAWVESGSTRAYTITGGASPQLQVTYTCTTPSAVSITASANPICSGTSETLTGHATGATTYSWSGPNGFTSTALVPAAFTTSTASAGVYTISATSTCNITTRATLALTVKTVPSAMGGSTTVCLGGTTVLSNTGIGGTWSRSNTRAAVTAAGVVTGVTAGTVNITYNTGCGAAAVQNMAVRTTPAAITGTANVCTGATVTLADATTGGTWSSSNTGVATISSAGVVTGVTNGTATITYNNAGCGIATRAVTALTSAGAISGSGTVCTGLSTTLTDATPTGTWSSSNTGRATVHPTTGVVTGISAGAVTITFSSGCGTNATFAMAVNASPAGITGNSSVCTAASTAMADATTAGTWSTSNTSIGTISATGTIYGVAQGAITVSYTKTGCSAIKAFTVKTTPGSITGASNICTGTSTTLTNASLFGTWSTSAAATASVDATGLVTGVANGSATITYSTGCGSNATKTETVISTPAAITGTTTVCSGATSTLADATGGGSWGSSDNATASVSAGGSVMGISQGTATITYSISSCAATATVTIKAVPATITGTSAFCGTGSATLSNTANAGTWASSDTTVAIIDPASGFLVVFAPGSAVISYANGCGSAATRTASYDNYPTALTGSTVICSGTTTTLADSISGGTWGSSNSAVASVDAAGLVTGLTAGSANISYSLTNGCGTNVVTQALAVAQVGTWQGGSSVDWNDAANWPCATIPDSTIDVVIPSGTAHLPDFTAATFHVKNFTVNAGVVISVSSDATVAVHGSLTNNGVANGDGAIVMAGTSAQTIYGKGTYSNLTINNAAGVTLNSGDTVRLAAALTLSSGTFTTNSGLRLISNATATARVAAITGGNISGNVNVEQYFSGGRRAYRFFAHPFNASIPLSMAGASLDITGNGGAGNGFTTTASNASSCYRYNPMIGNSSLPSDPGWKAFLSANGTNDTNEFKQHQGIRLFVRGAKGEGLGYAPYTPSAATVYMMGQLNTGTQVVTMHKGPNSDYNMVGNPYASATDIGAVINTAHAAGQVTGSAFYVWNPFLGAAGAFEAKVIGGSYILDQNSSFQVRAANDGSTLTFHESDKAANGDETLLRTAPSQYIALSVVDANNHGWDKMYLSFNDNATSNEDAQYDATKATNPDLNFYSYAGNTKLAVDARPYSSSMVIPMGFTTSYAQQYTIKAENMALPAGATLYLHDKMLNQYVLLQSGTSYSFDITADKATQGENRFELTATTGAAATTGLSVTMSPNPATDKVTIAYTTAAKAATTVTIMNVAGASVMSQILGNDASGKATISISELPAGVYMVEVTSGSSKKIQKLVKE